MSTRSQITTEINLRINDNITQDITPLDVRTVLDLLNANGINYDDDVLTGNYSKNFSITRANLQTAISGSALVLKAFYLITNAVGNTRVVLVQASSANTLYAYATDVDTGAIGTYNVSTDVFTAPSGSGVAGVTGNIVDNTDPANPIVTSPYTKDANDNLFYNGITATLGSGCSKNIFHQAASSNILGDNCVNNIFEQEANGFTFGNGLQNVTIRSGGVGQDFSASPTYDFLYNQDSAAEIYYQGGDFYHKIIDATKHQYIVTNLTTLDVFYYGVGAIPILRADLQALQTASSLIPGQAYIITNAVGSTAIIQVVADTTSALYTGAINLSASTVGSYTINSDTYTVSGGGSSGIPKATASGTDTYTATITGVASYADGDAYLIRFPNGNTTSATLNINTLGAKTLYRNNDGALIGGDIWAGAEMLCIYNSTLNGFQCIGTSPNSLFSYVTNAETITINKGQPVYVFGGQGDRITVKLASNLTDATSAQTIGIVASTSIGANQKGIIIIQGQLDNLNIFPTSTWADGDIVYLGATAGTVTKTKPYAPNHLVYLGYVTTANTGNAGRMYVKVQNGYEMDELHNVSAQSPNDGDLLKYNTATNLWETQPDLSLAYAYIFG